MQKVTIDDYSLLQCARARDGHFYEKPIALTCCHHAVCRRCVKKLRTNNNTILCAFDGKKCKVESLDMKKESELHLEHVRNNLTFMLNVIKCKRNDQLNKAESCYFDYDLNFSMIVLFLSLEELGMERRTKILENVKRIEDEIKKRREVLMQQVEQSYQSAMYDLKKWKENMIEDERIEYEMKLPICRNSKNHVECLVYEKQDILREANDFIQKVELLSETLEFNISNDEITEKSIGEIQLKEYFDGVKEIKYYKLNRVTKKICDQPERVEYEINEAEEETN